MDKPKVFGHLMIVCLFVYLTAKMLHILPSTVEFWMLTNIKCIISLLIYSDLSTSRAINFKANGIKIPW